MIKQYYFDGEMYHYRVAVKLESYEDVYDFYDYFLGCYRPDVKARYDYLIGTFSDSYLYDGYIEVDGFYELPEEKE